MRNPPMSLNYGALNVCVYIYIYTYIGTIGGMILLNLQALEYQRSCGKSYP